LGKDKPRFCGYIESLLVQADLISLGTTDLFSNLECFADILLQLLIMMEQHPGTWEADFCDHQIFERLGYCAEIAVHIGWCLVKSMKDLPEAPKPVYTRRRKIIETLTIRSWRLLYNVLTVLFSKQESSQGSNFLSEILIWVHDQLGAYRICGGDDGALLKLIIQHIASADPYYHYELYQSFCCLYGTDIKVNSSQELYDHHCNKSSFGNEAALILFRFIHPLLKERIDTGNYRAIGKDVRDCLDMIAEVFPSPPLEDPFVQLNQKSLESLLSSELNLGVLDPRKSQPLVMHDLTNRSSVPPVTSYLHYFQGKIALNNFYIRQDRTMDYLATAVSNLKYHVIVNPTDLDAWVSLANAYSIASQDILSNKVTDYRDRLKIASLQRCAFHCFVRAIKLIPQSAAMLTSDYKILLSSLLWGDLALLLQCIISAPMNCAALKQENLRKEWIERANQSIGMQKSTGIDDSTVKLEAQAYGTMCFVLKKASLWDPHQWLYNLRLAHAYRKLGRESKSIISVYIQAVQHILNQLPKEQHDQALDPLYKAIVFVLKSKVNRRITDDEANDFLSSIVDSHPGLREAIEGCSEQSVFHDPYFARIHVALESMKKLDKKRLHHKPYYRIAWMYSTIEHNDELAKEEMVVLLNARSKTVMRRIWKTEYELPGRHFIYFHQYLKFLIELSSRTRDVNLLWQLCKRLRGEENIILRFQLWLDTRKLLLEVFLLNEGTKCIRTS
jgi:hypothetical protein